MVFLEVYNTKSDFLKCENDLGYLLRMTLSKGRILIMRKVVLLTIALVLISASYCMAVDKWVAVKTNTPPAIDAEFDAVWQNAAEFSIDDNTAKSGGTRLVLLSLSNYKNPTGKFYLLWDDNNLYFYAKVTDPSVYFGRKLGQPLNAANDTVQMCFDPTNQRKSDSAGAYIIDMGAGSSDNSGPAIWEHWNIKGVPGQVAIAGKVLRDGYEIEAAFSWSMFADLVQPTVGQEYPFGVIIMDSAPMGVVSMLMDYGSGANVIGQPMKWNTLTLSE